MHPRARARANPPLPPNGIERHSNTDNTQAEMDEIDIDLDQLLDLDDDDIRRRWLKVSPTSSRTCKPLQANRLNTNTNLNHSPSPAGRFACRKLSGD